VLGEAIEQGGGQLVVAEDAVPLAEGEVATITDLDKRAAGHDFSHIERRVHIRHLIGCKKDKAPAQSGGGGRPSPPHAGTESLVY
jgi:hypothetical protein